MGKGIVFVAGLFLAILAFYGACTNKALAATYDASQISVTLSANNNFYRVSPDTSTTIPVSLVLNSPSTLNFDGFSRDTISGQFGGADLMGIRIGVDNAAQDSTICQSVTGISTGLSTVFACNFPYVSNEFSNTFFSTFSSDSWTQGQSLSFNVVVDSGFLAKEGLTASDQGTVYQMNFYPYLDLQGISKNPAFSPPKTVYLQVYNNATEVAQNQNSPLPGGPNGQPIPSNTSATSSPGQTAVSGGLFGLVTSVIVYIASVINQLIYFLFYWLVAPLIQAVLSIHVYTDQFVNVIYPGWEIVRNVCNILFIVAIIAMGMATLLRVESYQWRHLLVQLVIAALLVNFSLIIGQSILALADTVQSQFLPNNVDVIRSLAQNLMVANNSTQLAQNTLAGNVNYIIQYLFFVAMAIGSFIVFAAIAVYLVIRMVVLWVLLMLSPVAYVARILPVTQGIAKTWWDNFIKYAFFTPIIAFFLNLTAVISASFAKNPVLQSIQSSAAGSTNSGAFAGSNSQNLSQFVFIVGSNILLLVFLILAIKVASYMGIAGGGMLSDIGEKGLKWPFQAAGKPFQAAGNAAKDKAQAAGMWTDRNTRLKLANKVAPKDSDKGLTRFVKGVGFGVLAPGSKGAAKKEEREHKYKEAKEMLGARAKDIVNPKAGAARKLELQRENEKVKKAEDTYANLSSASLRVELKKVIDNGDFASFKALMKVATKEEYLDDIKNDASLGAGNIDSVYAKAKAKAKKPRDGQMVDETEKHVNNNEADKGRYQNMTSVARASKLANLSIEDMTKVDKDLYMSGGAALTGTATASFQEIITAMGSDPSVARDMIKKLKKKEKTALRTLLGARGAPVTVPTGINAADAASAKGYFDTYVP